MTISNRIKCAAYTDSSGYIIPGAAVTGYKAVTDFWSPGMESPGHTPYLLEDTSGNWEIGIIFVDSGSATVYVGSGASRRYRIITEDSAGTTSGFANGTSGLTFSQVPTARSVWNEAGYYGSASAVGGLVDPGIADSLSIGSYSNAKSTSSVAIGKYASATIKSEVSIGSAEAPNTKAIPIGSGQIAESTTENLTEYGGTSISFGTWNDNGNLSSGVLRIYGALQVANNATDVTSKAYSNVYLYDYNLWRNTDGSVEIIGTPSITSVFSGTSAPTVTVAVATDGSGMLKVTNSAAPSSGIIVVARSVMHVDVMAINWF